MKLKSKEPYWLLKNGLINSYPSLQQDMHCDILIIGGGITGSLLAYQLSGEGYDTVIVDKRDVAMGSTSATTALIQYEIDEPLYSLIDKVGEDAAIDSYKEGIRAIAKLEKIAKAIKADCGFKRKQSLYIADTSSNLEWLEREYRCREQNQFNVSWLPSADLKNNYGIEGKGGILSANGASLDAYKLTHSLLDYSLKKYNLKIFDHTSADKIVHKKKDNLVITDNGNVITCKKIIFASGYETQSFLKKKIVNLISTYALISEPLLKIPEVWKDTIFWNTQDPYLYLRSTDDNRVLIGGGDEQFKNALLRDKLIDKKEKFLLKSASKLIPNLNLISDFSWAGTFGVTKDALPFIGEHPDFPNSYFVLGFGGNGITFSTMGMEIISDALAGNTNKFLKHFRFNR